jgi:AraC-like DNA-binding protein
VPFSGARWACRPPNPISSKLHFKSPDNPNRQWLEWYREVLSHRIFEADVEPGTETPFWLDATCRLLPDLSLYAGASSPMRLRATAEATQQDNVGLTIVLAGEMSVRSADSDLVLLPGAAGFGRPAAVLDTRSNAKILAVRLSPRILAPLVPDLPSLSLVSIPAESEALRLLTGYLRMLDSQETLTTPEARHLAAMHVHELVALALGATREAAAIANANGVRAARRAAIKQHVLSNLADERLSLTTAAARQRLSPRYAQMLFEDEGTTFSEFVLGQRLTRAHRMLGDPRFAGTTISTIAFDVGLGDLSYFNRTFRARFGMTPSDVRAAAVTRN